MQDDVDEVRRILAAAGLPATDSEIEQLAAGLPLHREQVASLWTVEETRYGEPALIFQAEPSLVDWG